ncbi:hypothetical protein [Ralstonia pseudosolanacearum]
MIIEFDDSFLEVDFAHDPNLVAGVDAVALAARRGDHYVFASRAVAKRLEAETQLCNGARGVMAHVAANYSFLAHYLRSFSLKAIVSAHNRAPTRNVEGIWIVPIQHFAVHGISQTVLLAENRTDAELYEHAATHYGMHFGGRSEKIKVNIRGGGGNTIAEEFQGIAERKTEICVCITDSDRLAPGCAVGAIARQCRETAAESDWLVYHFAAECRELENSIPRTILLDTVANVDPENYKKYQEVQHLFTEAEKDHADLKESTNLAWIFRQGANSPQRTFWLEAAKKREDVAAGECFKNGQCWKEKVCDCVVVPGLGKKVASHVLQAFNHQSPHEAYKQNKNAPNFSTWLEIGKAVFEMGAGPKPMRL